MTAFAHILVPIDYSEASDASLRVAGQIARAFKGRLLVVHVLPLSVYMAEFQTFPIESVQVARETERLRQHVRAVLEPDGEIPALEVDVEWDMPLQHILELAAERHVDVIVMGTHGRTGIKHVLLGSVAEKVVRLAPCPVLTVRADTAARVDGLKPARPAVLHPERRLGTLGGLMRRRPLTIEADASLEEAHRLMSDAGVRHLPVVERGKLVGMLSARDFPAYAGQFEHTRVHVVMTPDPVTIGADVTSDTAARLMLERRVRALPVVDGERVIGIVSTSDILEEYARAARL